MTAPTELQGAQADEPRLPEVDEGMPPLPKGDSYAGLSVLLAEQNAQLRRDLEAAKGGGDAAADAARFRLIASRRFHIAWSAERKVWEIYRWLPSGGIVSANIDCSPSLAAVVDAALACEAAAHEEKAK